MNHPSIFTPFQFFSVLSSFSSSPANLRLLNINIISSSSSSLFFPHLFCPDISSSFLSPPSPSLSAFALSSLRVCLKFPFTIISYILTFFLHAHSEAFLQSTRLAVVSSSVVNHAVPCAAAGVLPTFPYAASKEALASLTRNRTEMFPRCFFSTDNAVLAR